MYAVWYWDRTIVDWLWFADLSVRLFLSAAIRFVVTSVSRLAWVVFQSASSQRFSAGPFLFGCCAGDYDNDGFLDLYVTNFGANILYHNNGNGTFTDVSSQAGVGDERWGASAAFADYDEDSYLDLFVVNYVDFKLDENPVSTLSGVRVYVCIARSIFF